jgi:hypothetical protein
MDDGDACVPSELWACKPDKILVVDSLPDVPNKSSLSKKEIKERHKVGDLLASGVPYTKIAEKMAKGDKQKAKIWRQKIRRWAASDPIIQTYIGDGTKGTIILGLPTASQALVKRASRGRVDAIKLMFEASGFHNPRVQHEHSGDIKVTIDIPRPERVDERPGNNSAEGPADETVVDADVVED